MDLSSVNCESAVRFSDLVAAAGKTSLTIGDFQSFGCATHMETGPVTIVFEEIGSYDFNARGADYPWHYKDGDYFIGSVPIDAKLYAVVNSWMDYGYWLFDGAPGSSFVVPNEELMQFDENDKVSYPGSEVLTKGITEYEDDEDSCIVLSVLPKAQVQLRIQLHS